MAIVIETDDDFIFTAAMCPPASPAVLDYYNNHMSNLNTNLLPLLTDTGRAFIQQAQESYAATNNAAAIYSVQHTLMQAKAIYGNPNDVLAYTDYRHIQQATPTMQRYMLAQPDLRQLHKRQLCSGYEDTFDYDFSHDSHYTYVQEYAEVTNHVVMFREEEAKVTNYFLTTQDRLLSDVEKSAIMAAWELVAECLVVGVDPTKQS